MKKMTKKAILRMVLCMGSALLFFSLGLVACQAPTQTEEPPAGVEAPAAQPEQPMDDAQAIPSTPAAAPVDATPEAETETDPAAIQAAWQSSPHALAFVVDAAGQNNTCASCHAPIDWLPSMATLPESCFACKFELEDPPPYIPENEWESIPCNVCHPVDRDDNIQPEIAWLEIPVLGEYAEVATPTELCLKCHAPIDIPGHGSLQLVSAHADYQCTDCHSAHDTMAISCSAVDCHADVIEPVTPIPGHDADHQVVSCVACHDGSGMEVGPDEETGLWTTFGTTGTAETGLERFAFTSHNVVLESSCDRCHYVGNPWSLSESVEAP